MPVPPNESMDPKKSAIQSKQSVVTAVIANVKDKKKCFDLMMAAIIFALIVVEFVSLYLQTSNATAIPKEYWSSYALDSYPKCNTISIWLISSFFLLKILRYNSCWDTKVITTTYFILQSINLLAVLTRFGSPLYFTIIYPIILSAILILIITKAIRWFIYK